MICAACEKSGVEIRRYTKLFWLNTDGQRTSYGKLAAGARKEQHTFAGHAWIAVDAIATVSASTLIPVFSGKL